MSKWEKRLAKIRQNPKHVRFEDVEIILLSLGFTKRQDGTSHATFTLPGMYPLRIPKPHKSPFIKEYYITHYFLPALETLGIIEEE